MAFSSLNIFYTWSCNPIVYCLYFDRTILYTNIHTNLSIVVEYVPTGVNDILIIIVWYFINPPYNPNPINLTANLFGRSDIFPKPTSKPMYMRRVNKTLSSHHSNRFHTITLFSSHFSSSVQVISAGVLVHLELGFMLLRTRETHEKIHIRSNTTTQTPFCLFFKFNKNEMKKKKFGPTTRER